MTIQGGRGLPLLCARTRSEGALCIVCYSLAGMFGGRVAGKSAVSASRREFLQEDTCVLSDVNLDVQ